MKRLSIRTFLLAALVSAAACSQGKGDPCQIPSDCESPYTCCPGLASDRGVCKERSDCLESAAGTGGDEDDSGAAGAGGKDAESSEENSSEGS